MDAERTRWSAALVIGLLALGPARAQPEAELIAEACAEQEVAEREMTSTYSWLLTLTQRSDSRLHEELEKSQRAWLLYRAAHLQALYGAEEPVAHYGQSWSRCLCLANSELTELRTEQLRRMHSGTKGETCSWERMQDLELRAVGWAPTSATVLMQTRQGRPDRPLDDPRPATGTICIAPFSVPDGSPELPPGSWPFGHWDVDRRSSNHSFTFRVDRHLTTEVPSHQMSRMDNVPIDRQVLVEVRLDQRPFETFFLHLGHEPEARVCLWFDPAYKRWLSVDWSPEKGCKCEADGKGTRADVKRE